MCNNELDIDNTWLKAVNIDQSASPRLGRIDGTFKREKIDIVDRSKIFPVIDASDCDNAL
jgi:hypothetical protein